MEHARPNALGPITFLSIGLFACHARPVPPSATTCVAGPAAQRAGVSEYVVVRDEPTAVEVDLLGRAPAHLSIRARAGAVSEVYSSPAAHFALSAGAEELRLGEDGEPVALAVRAPNGWRANAILTSAQRGALALLAAVNQDMAVQGTSIVHGSEYVGCTLACQRAVTCLPLSDRIGGDCAQTFANCAFCLEVDP